MRNLTAKQNKFISGVAHGLTQSEAYRRAYNAGNMKIETIANKASLLAHRGDIGEIIAKRKKELADKELWGREKALKILKELVDESRENSTEMIFQGGKWQEKYNAAAGNVAIKAIEQANKMCGYNEPEKIEITNGQTFRVVIDDG